jgi:acetoacetyl-CoA synthetase
MIDQPLWRPTSEQIAGSNMTAFARDAALRWDRVFDDYTALHQWSVSEPGQFWASVWEMAGVIASGKIDPVVENPKRLPGARWFPNVRLNFARNLLRRRDDAPALIFRSEDKIKRAKSLHYLL